LQEGNVSLQQKGSSKKRKREKERSKDQRAKEGKKTHLQDKGMKSSKEKKADESSRLVGETFSKKVKIEITISYSAKIQYVAPSIPTYHLHLHYLPILDFPSHPLSTISFLINLD
jgi:hypothetical protein